MNGRPVYFKEETLEERRAQLTNQFMMPDNEEDGAMAMVGRIGIVVMMALISLIVY